MQVLFFKYQGTGNDFIILDNREKIFDGLTQKQINKMCNRRFGIGADGLIMLENMEGYDFKMVYFNADGNPSTMCGNGGRCLVQFAKDQGISKYTYYFTAPDGDHEAEIDNYGNIRLKMKDVNGLEEHTTYALVDTGSPHYIKLTNNIEKVDVVEEGRAIRNSKPFAEQGINVNFVEPGNDDSIFVRTYERGVEDETMSCGTGVTASALLNAHNNRGFNRVEVKTPGGVLSVEFNKVADDVFENIWLCGPANFVYKGEIEVED